MSFHVPFALGGPVLHHELVRAGRQVWSKVLRYAYLVWLVLQLLDLPAPWVPGAWGDYFLLLLRQQLVLLLLLTPAITAGAVGYEKEKDTLSALFGTQLEPRQILMGKLLGRLSVVAGAVLPALPLLVLAFLVAEVGLVRLFLALAQELVLTFALGAGCLLIAVWTRRAGDAILACYSVITLGFLVSVLLLSTTSLPTWLNPVAVLDGLAQSEEELPLGPCLLHLAFWAALGAGCFALAAVELAPAARRQADRHVSRWLWELRPAVGSNPVRWRERYVLGLAPLPWLRMVPGWVGLLGVLVFSAVFAADGLSYAAGAGLRIALEQGDFATAQVVLRKVNDERVEEGVNVMGLILLGLGTLIVGVRCAGSVAEEKRRKTWEDLLLTPLSLEEIVEAKKWGVLDSAIPAAGAYALPWLALASMGGPSCVFRALLWLGGTAIALVLAATFGAGMSLSGETRDGSPRGLRSYIPRPEERGVVTDPWATGESCADENITQDRRRYTS